MTLLPFSPFLAPQDPYQEAASRLQGELRGLFEVQDVHLRRSRETPIIFSGRYLAPERADGYDEIRRRFQPYGFTPLLRHDDGSDHHADLVHHTDGGDDGVQREDHIEQQDLNDDG